jgi:hypothetical protein
MSAHAGADTGADVFAAHGVSRVTFEPLNQGKDRQCGRMGHEQVHVVAWRLNSTNSAHMVRIVCSQKVTVVSVNTGWRYLVTNTRWACSSDPLCRARRRSGLSQVVVRVGGYTDALPVPHRTDTGPTADVGAA